MITEPAVPRLPARTHDPAYRHKVSRAEHRLAQAHPDELEELMQQDPDNGVRAVRTYVVRRARRRLKRLHREEFERYLAEEGGTLEALPRSNSRPEVSPKLIAAVVTAIVNGKPPWNAGISRSTHVLYMKRGRAGDEGFVGYATQVGKALEDHPLPRGRVGVEARIRRSQIRWVGMSPLRQAYEELVATDQWHLANLLLEQVAHDVPWVRREKKDSLTSLDEEPWVVPVDEWSDPTYEAVEQDAFTASVE